VQSKHGDLRRKKAIAPPSLLQRRQSWRAGAWTSIAGFDMVDLLACRRSSAPLNENALPPDEGCAGGRALGAETPRAAPCGGARQSCPRSSRRDCDKFSVMRCLLQNRAWTRSVHHPRSGVWPRSARADGPYPVARSPIKGAEPLTLSAVMPGAARSSRATARTHRPARWCGSVRQGP
jgi:hypothetical protein